MAVTGEPLAGTDGAAFVFGLEITLAKWEFVPSSNVMNVPNFKGGGYNEVLAGLRKATCRGSCYWDASQNPNQSPPNIRDGVYLEDVYLYASRTQGLAVYCPRLLIETVPIRNDVEGKVDYEWTGHTDSIYYYPGDTDASLSFILAMAHAAPEARAAYLARQARLGLTTPEELAEAMQAVRVSAAPKLDKLMNLSP